MLIRIDGAAATHEPLGWIVGQRMSYSVGFTLPGDFADQLTKMPKKVWTPAYNSDGEIRDGAWVAEISGMLHLGSWPTGMRVFARKERSHPGAQLRITDADGLGVTAFATNTTPGGPGRQPADLELRHRRRARADGRIRWAKDTGSTNLPLHDLDHTASGAPWSRWPARSPPGPSCSPYPSTPHDGGNPNDCACGCSPSPAASHAPDAEQRYTGPNTPRYLLDQTR